METELKLQFPTVMRYKPNDNRFVGIFKTIQNENIFASFNVPNYPQALGISFDTGVVMLPALYQQLINKSDGLNFLEFLKEFQKVLSSCPKLKIFKSRLFERFHYEFRDLKQLYRNEKFVFDPNNETLNIIHTNDYGVQNEFLIQLNFFNEDLQLYEVLKHNFPPSTEKLFHAQCSLKLIHKHFLNAVNTLTPFYETMHKIDSVCWVTAPKDPNNEHTYRTIVLEENTISMKITFDPWNVHVLPEFKFFGPSNVVQEYKNTLSLNLINWDPSGDIIQNILKVFDLPYLPVKPTTSGENTTGDTIILYDSDTECCICFSYHLNDETPSIRCENKSCRRYFHQDCLYEWLSRIAKNDFFANISGPCPNCEKTISCAIPANTKNNF